MRIPVTNQQNLNDFQKNQLQCMVEQARQAQTSEPPKTFDPVNLLPTVVEFFLPIGSGDYLTLFGFWIDSQGFLKITIQQAIVPDNLFAQMKIMTLRLPSALLLAIFFFGFGMFSLKLNILGQRAAVMEKSTQIQKMLQKVMDSFNNQD